MDRVPNEILEQICLYVRHYMPKLLAFRLTRDANDH